METEAGWHAPIIEQLSQFFRNEPDARAFVLTGSLADGDLRPDRWSDVDACIVLAHRAPDRYHRSTGWLRSFGQIVGLERHEHPSMSTLRVCLEGLRRLDLTFIAESALDRPASWDRYPFYPSFAVLWSRLPGLAAQIASLPRSAVVHEFSSEEIEAMADAFWLRAAVATTKMARDDLLIGLHLALDLARDCLLVQMMRRDREKGTTLHRIGGWENELAARFCWDGQEQAGEGILALIRASCEAFDELASDMLPDYEPRGPLLYSSIESAAQLCAARAN